MPIDIGSAVAYLELDTSRYVNALRTAQSQMSNFSNSSHTSMQKLEGIGQGLTTVGSALTMGLTVPITSVGVASSKLAMDFESQMSRVKAISGATGEEFDQLSELALQLGKDTSFSAKHNWHAS